MNNDDEFLKCPKSTSRKTFPHRQHCKTGFSWKINKNFKKYFGPITFQKCVFLQKLIFLGLVFHGQNKTD